MIRASRSSYYSELLHAILGVVDSADLLARPWVGESREGHVIEQILGTLRSVSRNLRWLLTHMDESAP